jgi:hypothetical protein
MKTLEPLHLDDVLRDFYAAEMPAPWPALKPPADVLPLPKRAARPAWLRKFSRLAFAASVAVLLIGYLALASLFPRDPASRLPRGEHISPVPGPRKSADRVQTPATNAPQRNPTTNTRLEVIADPIPGGFIFTPGTRP